MAKVMAVWFEKYGRLYYLDPGEHAVGVGDHVLFPTEAGPEVAECVWAPEWVSEGSFEALAVCGGFATDEDRVRDAENKKRRAEARLVANRMIRRHELPMKVVGVDYLDRSEDFDKQVVVYFTAPHRVDFRALVGELAKALRARIDLRQIGSREAASITGGIGSCGRELCCATFGKNFDPVSLRMARLQDLPANPMRISGACGRLMCCLKYEHPLYVDFVKSVPAVGERATSPEGDGVVVGHSVPTDTVVLKLLASGEVTHCDRASVCSARKSYDSRPSAGSPE